MLVIDQKKEKITDNISFKIQERTTCKNIFINEKDWQKFKKITNKQDKYISLNELNGLGELLGKSMTKTLALIIQNDNIFGIYDTKNRAKEIMGEIIKTYASKSKSYYMPEN